MPLLTPGLSCIHVLSSSMYDLNTCDYSIEIYISSFPLKLLCILTRLVKATHNIKTSLIKQCYTWYVWTGATDTADTDMLLILLILILLILIYWYCWGMYALYYMLYVLCLTSIYFTTVSRWNHAVANSRSLKTKPIQPLNQHFEIIQNIVSS
jgi:hypothetical protein